MRKYFGWIAAGLIAVMALIIKHLSSALKRAKTEKAASAAKAETYENEMDHILKIQKQFDAVDQEEAPNKLEPPADSDDRLDRLNRVSDKGTDGESVV